MENNSNPWNLHHEIRIEELPEGVKAVSDSLKIPIQRYGLWIMSDDNELEGKYADYFPQLNLLVLTEDGKTGNVLKPTQRPLETIKAAPLSHKSETSEVEYNGGSLLDGIEEDICDDTYHQVSPDIQKLLENRSVDEYVNSQFFNVNIASFDDKTLADHIFKVFTSAKYYWRQYSLYAEAMNDNGYIAHQSKLRYNEVIRLLTAYLKFFSDKAQFSNVENFAIDTPQYVIYFHLDKGGDEDIRLNKHLYNDENKDVMPFYDSKNNMEKIPYGNWASILEEKPVLMFGWEPLGLRGWINCFLGEYNAKEIDSRGNFVLSSADMRFDFPV